MFALMDWEKKKSLADSRKRSCSTQRGRSLSGQKIGKSNYAENTCNTEDTELSKNGIVSALKMILASRVVSCMQSFNFWGFKRESGRFLACGVNNVSQTIA